MFLILVCFFLVFKVRYLVFFVYFSGDIICFFIVFNCVYLGYYYGYLMSIGKFIVDCDGVYVFLYNIEVVGFVVNIVLVVNGNVKVEIRFDGCYMGYDDMFVVIVLELVFGD